MVTIFDLVVTMGFWMKYLTIKVVVTTKSAYLAKNITNSATEDCDNASVAEFKIYLQPRVSKIHLMGDTATKVAPEKFKDS